MNWEEVRRTYPNRFVKIKVINSHITDNKRVIDDVAVIDTFDDNRLATRELVRSQGDILVYHTGNEKMELEIKNILGYRGIQG